MKSMIEVYFFPVLLFVARKVILNDKNNELFETDNFIIQKRIFMK